MAESSHSWRASRRTVWQTLSAILLGLLVLVVMILVHASIADEWLRLENPELFYRANVLVHEHPEEGFLRDPVFYAACLLEITLVLGVPVWVAGRVWQLQSILAPTVIGSVGLCFLFLEVRGFALSRRPWDYWIGTAILLSAGVVVVAVLIRATAGRARGSGRREPPNGQRTVEPG